jgi:imidazolonepropionase-like amidohydrolase
MLQQRIHAGSSRLLGLSLALLLAACGGQPETTQQAAAPAAAAPAASAAVITAVIYEGATLIKGDGSAPIENATFVVDGGRFFGVGATGAIAIPPDAPRVNLAGATVMPAIIDAHVHLSTERDALVADLQRRATFGVSAAFSMGTDDGDDIFAVRRNPPAGVALYRTAGRGLVGPEPGRTEVPHWITTVDEARAAVQEEAAKNVDIIKIWVDDRNGEYTKLTPELYGAIIDEAHANNLRVTAHIFTLEDAKGLIEAGVDAFAHGVRESDVDDEIIGMLQARPWFVVVPNLPGRGVPTDLAWLEGRIAAEQLAQLQTNNVENPTAQEAYGIQARNLARMNEAGVKLTVGTDGNTPWGVHIEMEDMVAAGVSPVDVIVAATRNGAEYLELRDRGVIATGKTADFIVLDANPLDDITNTRRIRDVYLRGQQVAR